jgi:polyhydroxybutyrate depolymerase
MELAMKRVLRIFLRGLIVVIVLAIALFGYFVYSPSPEVPRLSGKLTEGTVQVGALKRTYMTYVPKGLAKGAPLVVVLHGSDQDGEQIRRWTGYGFDRLADEHGFAVAYPNGYEGYWNACNIVGDYSANKLNIDDLGFLTAIVDKLVNELGIDPGRVFATGVSRGGHMAFRLALEAPSRFRAVAAVAANLPTPENFKCKPAEQGTSSVMIMNGMKDPLNPFDGGEVKFFGLIRRGRVRSSRESGQYFAALYHIPSAPQTDQTHPTDGADVTLWQNDPKVQVELVAIRGGGHVMPQPYWRAPRILGPTPKEPNGPAMIWNFFERQAAR